MKLQIKIDGKTYEAEVEVLEEDASPGYVPYLTASAPAQPALAPGAYVPVQAAEPRAANEKQYRSPVTGLVIRMSVAPGQQIQLGDEIVVLEAMKMETTITAHRAGTVKLVNVAPGDPVKLHQVLVELE